MGQIISGESAWRRTRRTYLGSAPAAGADWSVTVPGGKAWRILSVRAALTTSVAAANRVAALTVSDGSAVFLTIPPAAVQAASLTWTYDWLEHGNNVQVGTLLSGGFPDLIIPAGFVIASSTSLLDAGDQWAAPRLYVVETWDIRGPVDLVDAAEVNVVVMAAPAS